MVVDLDRDVRALLDVVSALVVASAAASAEHPEEAAAEGEADCGPGHAKEGIAHRLGDAELLDGAVKGTDDDG